jgi:hypothetical protein
MRVILSLSFILLVVLSVVNAKFLVAASKDPIEIKKEVLSLEKDKQASKKDDAEKDEDQKKGQDFGSPGNLSEQVAASIAPVTAGTFVMSDGVTQTYSSK